jgi:hypothetical protein
MQTDTFIGVAATLFLFLPVIAIIYYRLYHHKSLLALMISYLITATYNFLSHNFIGISPEFLQGFGVVNNYLDVPLMLIALLFFCPIKQKQRNVYIISSVYVVYELVLATQFGLDPAVVVYIMGPGLAIIVSYSFYLFIRHIRITIVYGKNSGRALMLVSILFGYGCYSLVYYFYYIQKTPDVADAFLLYFISSIAASVIMTIGLHRIQKRLKQLKEVQNTRRELAIFFNT